MNARDRMIFRSVATLLAVTVAMMLLQAVLPSLQVRQAWTSLAFLALFAGALGLMARGRTRLAAWILVGLGVPLFAVRVWVTGGPEGEAAVYAPLAAVTVWSWLGRRVGLTATALYCLALAVSWWLLPGSEAPRDEHQRTIEYLVAALIGIAFVGSVTSDLKIAAETAWRRAAEAEQSASAALALDGARDRFLAMVSHELRTPLDTVLGYAELLAEEEADLDRARDLGRIHAAGRQLLGLIDDLLDMSQMQLDEVTLHCEKVELGALVDEVVTTAKPLADAQGDRIVVRVQADLPEVVSDRRRIRQILLNLVTNSAKYTRDGEIALEVTVDGGELRLSVRDSGVGIPADKLPDLFQPFVQLHEGPDRRPGVGLGLALSQRLASRLGGKIEATSRQGEGSTFVLRLPIRLGGPAASSRS